MALIAGLLATLMLAGIIIEVDSELNRERK